MCVCVCVRVCVCVCVCCAVISNVYLKSAVSESATVTRVSLLADGYETYQAAAADLDALFPASNPSALSQVSE